MLTEKNLSWASKSALKEEQERDLAIWWEAYLQLLASVARNGGTLYDKSNCALSDYRAKREELCK